MSRTFRNRHGYVWWKQNERRWYKDEEYTLYNQHDLIYSNKASRSWRLNKPNGADGAWSGNGRKGRLSKHSSYIRRNNERVFLIKVMKDEDIDYIPYPSEKQTKFFIWHYF